MDHPPTRKGQRLSEWHRGLPERRIAGVCAALADQLELPLPVVRAAFILLVVIPGFRGAGLVLYLALWFLMPAEPGAPSGLDRLADLLGGLGGWRDERDESDPERSDEPR